VIARRHPANDDRILGLINSDKSAGRDLKGRGDLEEAWPSVSNREGEDRMVR
jgi:hypothetical protein